VVYHKNQTFVKIEKNEITTFFLERIHENGSLEFFIVTMKDSPRSLLTERVTLPKDFEHTGKGILDQRPMSESEKYSIWGAIFWYAKG